MFVEVVLAFSLAFWLYRNTRKPNNFPPGPFNLPVVGYLPFVTKYPARKFTELSGKYGDVFSIQLGSYRTVVLCSLKSIKEALKNEDIADRPDFERFKRVSQGRGVLLSGGNTWHEMRRFTLRHLRDFGLGKSSLEGIVNEEIQELLASLKKSGGQPIELTNMFNLAVLNALWTILSGKRFRHDDPEALQIVKDLTERITETSSGAAADVLPWLSRLGLPNKVMEKNLRNVEHMKTVIRKIIKEHEEKHEEGLESDFIHIYLTKMYEEDNPASPFYREEGMENLVMVMADLFTGGAETTSTTLLWFALLMATYPEIQAKVQREIDSVFSRDQSPSTVHRSKLPYTEAVLLEVLRFTSLLPLGVVHVSSQRTKFMGYDIPKGTVFMPNLYQVMHDPEHWQRPFEFYPEHFLQENGTLKTSEALIPFAVGRRICLGESLARMELFLFATSLLQAFTIQLPAGLPGPSLEPRTSIIAGPQPFKVVLSNRNS